MFVSFSLSLSVSLLLSSFYRHGRRQPEPQKPAVRFGDSAVLVEEHGALNGWQEHFTLDVLM